MYFGRFWYIQLYQCAYSIPALNLRPTAQIFLDRFKWKAVQMNRTIIIAGGMEFMIFQILQFGDFLIISKIQSLTQFKWPFLVLSLGAWTQKKKINLLASNCSILLKLISSGIHMGHTVLINNNTFILVYWKLTGHLGKYYYCKSLFHICLAILELYK